MKKSGRLGSPEQPCKENLPSSGVEQIFAANDEVHALRPVVDGDRELIRPVPVAIPNEYVAALCERLLGLRTQPQIVESHDAVVEPDSQSQSGLLPQMSIAARPRIAMTFEI